jgi:hypothetical protein
VAAYLDGTTWRELSFPSAPFTTTDRFVDVAAVPGTPGAWAAVERFEEAAQTGAVARVAQLNRDGTATVTTLPESGPGRGAAEKVAFTGPDEGWMVTATGWVFHYTDGTVHPRNTDPAFASVIGFRPNEAAEQFIPDAPPVDDSELFKPPPVEIEQEPPPAVTRRLPALMRQVRTKLRGRTLVVTFRLTRQARVQLLGRRKGRTVARTKSRMLKPGRHRLRMKLNPRRWPQRLSFRVREPGAPTQSAPSGDTVPADGDTISTGGDTVATRNGLRRGGD